MGLADYSLLRAVGCGSSTVSRNIIQIWSLLLKYSSCDENAVKYTIFHISYITVLGAWFVVLLSVY